MSCKELKDIINMECTPVYNKVKKNHAFFDGKYYEDGECIGEVINTVVSDNKLILTVKRQSENPYINGTIKTIIINLKQKT